MRVSNELEMVGFFFASADGIDRMAEETEIEE